MTREQIRFHYGVILDIFRSLSRQTAFAINSYGLEEPDLYQVAPRS